LLQGAEITVTGIVKFFSKDELKRYMKALVEKYQSQNQMFGDQLGVLLRTLEQEKAAAKAAPKESKDSKDSKGQNAARAPARGWVKMGTMAVNVNDPNGAMAEVLFQLHEDVKAKLAKSTEALKSFDELNSQTIPEAGVYYLQLRNGVPERIVVDLASKQKETFNFTADFKLV
jgi:hypothetical protein